MTLRRWIALLMLLLVAASSVESVIGVLRDGEVHHEAAGAAAAHAPAAVDGEHGHEDDALPGDHQHGPGHQHGTPADHCTHQHATPLLHGPFAFSLPPQASTATYPEPPVHTGGLASSSFRPPRA